MPADSIGGARNHTFGKDAFAAIELENIKWTRLFEADKSDPLNQLRVVGWKAWDGVILQNQQFLARIESSVSNSGVYG